MCHQQPVITLGFLRFVNVQPNEAIEAKVVELKKMDMANEPTLIQKLLISNRSKVHDILKNHRGARCRVIDDGYKTYRCLEDVQVCQQGREPVRIPCGTLLRSKTDLNNIKEPTEIARPHFALFGFSDNLPHISCDDCVAGKHQTLPKQNACKDCLAGKYQDQRTQQNCVPCLAGLYSDQNLQIICKRKLQKQFKQQTATTGSTINVLDQKKQDDEYDKPYRIHQIQFASANRIFHEISNAVKKTLPIQAEYLSNVWKAASKSSKILGEWASESREEVLYEQNKRKRLVEEHNQKLSMARVGGVQREQRRVTTSGLQPLSLCRCRRFCRLPLNCVMTLIVNQTSGKKPLETRKKTLKRCKH